MTETVDDLLNKIEAIFDCGAGKPNELAKHMGRAPQRVSEYIRQRKHRPSVLDYFSMKSWASEMTTRIAMAGRKLQSSYRTAYREVCAKRLPVDGRN
jgi:hypothetical protein